MRELLGIDEDLTLAFPIGVSQLIQGSDLHLKPLHCNNNVLRIATIPESSLWPHRMLPRRDDFADWICCRSCKWLHHASASIRVFPGVRYLLLPLKSHNDDVVRYP